jgi:hypothetical protein
MLLTQLKNELYQWQNDIFIVYIPNLRHQTLCRTVIHRFGQIVGKKEEEDHLDRRAERDSYQSPRLQWQLLDMSHVTLTHSCDICLTCHMLHWLMLVTDAWHVTWDDDLYLWHMLVMSHACDTCEICLTCHMWHWLILVTYAYHVTCVTCDTDSYLWHIWQLLELFR